MNIISDTVSVKVYYYLYGWIFVKSLRYTVGSIIIGFVSVYIAFYEVIGRCVMDYIIAKERIS